MGVFATRSPFRPNALGLSAVKLERVELDPVLGPVLEVSGGDLMDGTPIYDIKPYLPYVDIREDASGGFTDRTKEYRLQVDCPKGLLDGMPEEKREALLEVLTQDPRPAYQKDPDRVYGFPFAGFEVKFRVTGTLLEICSVQKNPDPDDEFNWEL